MNTSMPPVPTPDALAAIAPRPAPVRTPDAITPIASERAPVQDRDGARDVGERDFATRLANEMRPESSDETPAHARRAAHARGREAVRDRGADVRTTPEARGDEADAAPVDEAPVRTSEPQECGDDAGGEEPPPGGKDLPPWLVADLLQPRPVPVTTQPPGMLDVDPVTLAAGDADAMSLAIAADALDATALATATTTTTTTTAPAAAAAAADAESAATALLASQAAPVDAAGEIDVALPASAAAAPAAPVVADAETAPTPAAGPGSDIARLLAQARATERAEAPVADVPAPGARPLPEGAQPRGADAAARPASVPLPAATANAVPARRGFAFAAAAAMAAADAASAAPPAAPRADASGPFALPFAAPAPTAAPPPAQLQIATPLDTPEWAQQLGERVNWLVSQDLTNAQLKLSPAHLGPIEIRISLAADQANVSFGTHSHVTREALEAAAPKLRDMLGAQGYTQVNVNVNVDVSQQAFRERPQSSSRYEPGATLALDAPAAAPAAASGTRATNSRTRLDAYA